MANIGTPRGMGEKLRSLGLATGLAIATATTATAQQTANIIDGTTFASIREANRAAQSSGMILARASNGQMLFVTPELAQILDEQGFSYHSDGSIRGYTQQGLFQSLKDVLSGTYQGYDFDMTSDFLQKNSFLIRVEEPSLNDSDCYDCGDDEDDY